MKLLPFVKQTVYANAQSSIDSEVTLEDEEDVFNALGWIPETLQMKNSVPTYAAPAISLVSSEIIDYTDAFPDPGNQGTQGSCVGWAVGYAAKSYLVNIGQKWGVKEHQFSPSYIYNQINGGVDEGSSIYEALQLVIEQGVCLLADMPYNENDFTTQPNQTQKIIAEQYRSLSMRRISEGDVNNMKVALQEGIPIVVGIPVYPDFDNLDSSNPIYDNSFGTSRGNHAICLIGYNDETNSFKFINSWGTSWGLNGYGNISYSLIETFDTTGWILYDAKMGLFADSSFNGTELQQYIPINENINSIVIPDGITSIGASAFVNQTGITSVTIPNTVTDIGTGAFWGCSNLETVNLPSSLTTIGPSAFFGCTSLTEIDIPPSVEIIGAGAFYNCYDLSDITLPSGLETVSNELFFGCTSLTNLTIPSSVTTIGNSAFKNCSALVSITIPNAVESIGTSLFYDCSSLASVTILGGIDKIKEYTFYGCTALTSINIPNTATSIGQYAFSGCTALTNVTGMSGVTSIGYMAFGSCVQLTGIEIPIGVTQIDRYAFISCTRLANINFNAVNCGDIDSAGVFASCGTMATSVQFLIGNSVARIPAYLFKGISKLDLIRLSPSIITVATNAFTNVDQDEVTVQWVYGNGTAEVPTGLKGYVDEIVFLEGVTAIGAYAFYGCEQLEFVTIPRTVESIGAYAFYNCGLRDIFMPKNVDYIGVGAFLGNISESTLYIEKSIIDDNLIVLGGDDDAYEDVFVCNAVCVPDIETQTAYYEDPKWYVIREDMYVFLFE